MSLSTSDFADWLQAGWGEGDPWPKLPEFQPGASVPLSTQPDRLVCIGLKPGPGLQLDGASLALGMDVLVRGDQRDPIDSERIAWAIWALVIDPGFGAPSSDRALIGSGLRLVTATAPATPTFAGLDGPSGAVRPLHSCTYQLELADA